MKILYICPDYGIPVLGGKGASVHVRELSSAFIRGHHQVVIASPLERKSLWEPKQETDAEFLHIPTTDEAISLFHSIKSYTEALGTSQHLAGEIRRIVYDTELDARLTRKFKNNPPDFIYVRSSLYSTTGITLKQQLNIPLIVEINTPIAMEQKKYRASSLGELAYAAEYKLLSNADAIVCVSNVIKEYVTSIGISPDRVIVIPNGVNPRFLEEKGDQLDNQLKLEGTPLLGFVGGLRPWHGIEILPDLLRLLKNQYPDVRMAIVGDGPLREDLENQFKQMDLTSNVTFTGNIIHQNIPGIVRQFDIALAPYAKLDHPFYFSPLKLFEYMAAGTAVVAAKIGQVEEIVNDGENGFLYSPADLDEMFNCCQKILSNPHLKQSISNNAQQLIREKHTWDHVANTIIDIAKSL